MKNCIVKIIDNVFEKMTEVGYFFNKHTGKQKQMNASYQASLVNRHIRRFTGLIYLKSTIIYLFLPFLVIYNERGRRPSEFSLNMIIFSS